MGVAGVEYDASAGIIETALRFKSTIVPLVIFGGIEFILLLFVNSVVCVTRHLKIWDPAAHNVDLPWGLTGVTGSLMTFFVCFYNQHVFGRYNKLYNLTKAMGENCLELACILRLQVESLPTRRKIAKMILASCFMFFFERTITETHEKISKDEYKQLKALDLLGDYELRQLELHCRIQRDEAVPSFMVLQWAMELMRAETEAPEERDDMLCAFYSRVYRVRRCQAEVVQILDLPMPFQYFHIMNLMLMLNLLLWAYSLGCEDSYFAPIIYMFVQLMFQGIRELSTALSDPFGDDDVDFPITPWMVTLYVRMYGILEDPWDLKKVKLDDVTALIDPVDKDGRKTRTWGSIDMFVDRKEDDEAEGSARSEPRSSEGYQRVSQHDEDESSAGAEDEEFDDA